MVQVSEPESVKGLHTMQPVWGDTQDMPAWPITVVVSDSRPRAKCEWRHHAGTLLLQLPICRGSGIYGMPIRDFLQSNASSWKFVPMKISSSKNFLLTSWGSQEQCVWGADPVNRQKFVVEPSRKLQKFFTTYDNFPVITTTVNRSSELAPSLWYASFSPTATYTLW